MGRWIVRSALFSAWARGFALVVIAYYIFSGFVPEEKQPQWISQARSLPVLVQTGDAIASLLPENPAEHLPGGPEKDQENVHAANGEEIATAGGGQVRESSRTMTARQAI